MATVNLGRIKPVWQGTWDSSTQYIADDIVYYGGHAWIAVTTSTNSAPADGNSNWDKMSQGVGTGSVTANEIADGAVTAAKLAPGAAVPDQTGHSGQFLTTNGTSADWAAINQDFDNHSTELGTYYNGGTFANSYGATTLRTVTVPAGKWIVFFQTSLAVQHPNSDPDGVTVQFREGSSVVMTLNHEETDTQDSAGGPNASRLGVFIRNYSSDTSVNIHVPAGGDGDAGGVVLHTMLKLIKLQ